MRARLDPRRASSRFAPTFGVGLGARCFVATRRRTMDVCVEEEWAQLSAGNVGVGQEHNNGGRDRHR